MKLRRVLRDQSGRLYEIPIIVMFLGVWLAVAVGQRSAFRGFLVAALIMGGLFVSLMLVVLGWEWLEARLNLEPVKRVLESRAFGVMRLIAGCVMSGVTIAVIAAFAAIFLAPSLSSTPEGQLLAMRLITAAGGLGGVALALFLRNRSASF